MSQDIDGFVTEITLFFVYSQVGPINPLKDILDVLDMIVQRCSIIDIDRYYPQKDVHNPSPLQGGSP